MPMVHPFAAVRYPQPDLSKVVAPPYDVLDQAAKQALLDQSRHNIVAIDLPHTPPKHAGPPEAYRQAGEIYRRWLHDGTLRRDGSPAIYVYRQQTPRPDGSTVERCGVCCCIDAVPFGPREGGGVLPHEETFGGPKEDRLALMRQTEAQLSPIFGLHADEQGNASQLARDVTTRFTPDAQASTPDGVRHEVWTVTDGVIIRAYQDALRGEDVFIADGHHRYTTHLNYLQQLTATNPDLPADHPARRCMIVLVGMNDPGLDIWPTHRVLGGVRRYDFDALLAAGAPLFRAAIIDGGLPKVWERLRASDPTVPGPGPIGLHDFASGRSAVITPLAPDPLAQRFPDRCPAWRSLDVAYAQHVIVDELCRDRLNDADPVQWAFPHTIDDVAWFGDPRNRTHPESTAVFGDQGAQLAVIVRPTPIAAVRDVSRAGQLMPQKSTFFYPKLATGLWIHPLR